jgi:hypothetical protein
MGRVWGHKSDRRARRECECTYSAVNDTRIPRIVVYINRDSSQRRHLGSQLVQTAVVLALALVGF